MVQRCENRSSSLLRVQRREWLSAVAALGPLAAANHLLADSPTPQPPAGRRWRCCLNTSCLRGQNLPLTEGVAIAAEAGYDGIEPWVREIEQFVQQGGALADLRKQIADSGLTVEGAIGFAAWIADDPEQRRAGLEQLRRDMDLVRQIGGVRIAAPPVGANRPEAERLDLLAAAERYRAILDIGREIGVTPQVEVWGHSRNLSRLGEAAFVAVESGHPDACILPDIYHLYRGGSDFAGLRLLSPAALHVFHVNDYPALPREDLNDADRVYPGDGDAPLAQIVDHLQAAGFAGALSLELFNRDYWQQDPREVARRGLASIRHMLELRCN